MSLVPPFLPPAALAAAGPAVRRRPAGAGSGFSLPAGTAPAGQASAPEGTQGPDAAGALSLLGIQADERDPPRRRRPATALLEDASDMLRRFQMLALGREDQPPAPAVLSALARELEGAPELGADGPGLALRLRIEMAKRLPEA